MSQRGIIYLIQPALLVGSKIYKLGCSNSPTLSRCINGYIKGTSSKKSKDFLDNLAEGKVLTFPPGSRYISIHECYDPLIVEKILIKKFNNLFRLAGGTESFEGDENIMSITILQTIIEYKQNNTPTNTPINTLTNTLTNTPTNDTINDTTNIKNNYNCKICQSYYSSYQSLWIHNKKYHTHNCEKCKKKFDNLQNKLTHQKICSCNSNQNVKLNLDILKYNTCNTTNNLLCKYCNKIFSRTDNLKRHQLKCNKNKFEKYDQELDMLKEKINTLEKTNITIKDNTELEEQIKTILLKINNKITDNNF